MIDDNETVHALIEVFNRKKESIGFVSELVESDWDQLDALGIDVDMQIVSTPKLSCVVTGTNPHVKQRTQNLNNGRISLLHNKIAIRNPQRVGLTFKAKYMTTVDLSNIPLEI